MSKKCHHWYSNPRYVASRVFTYSLLGYTTSTTTFFFFFTSVISPLSELLLTTCSTSSSSTSSISIVYEIRTNAMAWLFCIVIIPVIG